MANNSSEKETFLKDNEELDIMQRIGPEVSIIPVERKRPSFKIRLFAKEYSPTDDQTDSVEIFSRFVPICFYWWNYVKFYDINYYLYIGI